ncbi:MAG: TolC family outer membrane protein [Proteobacteria bacterium]|nr:TolC family outer membrane protein [Pseudomonadota bacterium]
MTITKSDFTGLGAGVLLSAFLFAPGARAEVLSKLVPDLLVNDNQVKAAEADVVSAREQARVALGNWFPNLDVSASYGIEDQKPEKAADTKLVPREIDLTITQLLWDFGSTNAVMRSARLTLEQARAVLDAARQNLLLQSVTAYLNVLRTGDVLDFSRQSESNLIRQTGLENALVERGAGFSTDVLQAKVQLAGASARRVRAEGALQVARNAFREVFGAAPGELSSMKSPTLPLDLLPQDVKGAVETAMKDNPQLIAANIGNSIARETVKQSRASGFFPKLEGVLEAKYKDDVGGTIGQETERLAKVQLTYPFNLGFTAVNTLRAAKSTLSATELRYADARDVVEQQARDAWENLRTSRGNAALLKNQANIASEFLDFARKERQLGRRSLIDVLAGETALIDASSDAASAEVDVTIAVYTLLNVMGRLEKDAIRN